MSARELWAIVKTTFVEFVRDRPLHHGAALSYYALMALVPVMYLSLSFFGSFVGHDTMVSIIREVLHEQIGINEVDGIIDFLGEVDLADGSLVLRIMGIAALMLSSTAILSSLRHSINEFYNLNKRKINRKKLIIKSLLFRGISMLTIASVTSVIIALYFAETFILSIEEEYLSDKEFLGWFFSSFARHGIPIILNIGLFTFIFKYLHNAKVSWRVARTAGIVTGIFLYLGQLIIKFYLTNYFFAADGGVAGTLLVILVWVYYSSQILFLGAKFAYIYGGHVGEPIEEADL